MSLASFLTVALSGNPVIDLNQAVDTAVVQELAPITALSLPDVIEEQAKELGMSANMATLAQSIAFCESTMRQFDKNGKVLRGRVDSADTGLFQINKRYHKARADKHGYDINTTEGNIGYALYLLQTDGSRHWNASKKCWG